MKYSGSSIVTTHQVGATVYIIENDVPNEVTVSSTESVKKGAGSVSVFYRFEEFPNKKFAASEVFASESALKTYFDAL